MNNKTVSLPLLFQQEGLTLALGLVTNIRVEMFQLGITHNTKNQAYLKLIKKLSVKTN